MTTFRHDVRLLACLECGGPAEVAVTGGILACGFCGAETAHTRRDELDLRAAGATEADEDMRLEILWLQRRAATEFGPALPAADAEAWSGAVKELRDRPSDDAEVRAFLLAQGVAASLARTGDLPRARAVVEATLEVVRARRHVQVLRCWMARTAARAGDAAAARQWLALCDPRSEDLEMDGAYRFSAAVTDGVEGRLDAVLVHLGRRLGDVPLPPALEHAAGLVRADALERTRGVPAAREELERLAAAHPRGWERLDELHRAAPWLCVDSFRRPD